MVEINELSGLLRAAAVACLLLIGVGACGSDDSTSDPSAPERPTPTRPGGSSPNVGDTLHQESTAASIDTTRTSTSSAGSAAHPTSSPSSSDPSTAGADPQRIEFAELRTEYSTLIDQRIEVTMRAFFLETCPPPDAGGGPCTLTLYAAEPDRDDLVYADRGLAAPVMVDGTRVGCAVGGDVIDACPGWQQRAPYVVTAVVRAARGGVGFALDVESWEPTGGSS